MLFIKKTEYTKTLLTYWTTVVHATLVLDSGGPVPVADFEYILDSLSPLPSGLLCRTLYPDCHLVSLYKETDDQSVSHLIVLPFFL